MHTTIPLAIAALLAAGIIVIGSFYIASPEKMTPSFGLKLPSPDPETRAWLRLKGIRDIVSGLVVLSLMFTTNPRTVGVALLAESFTAFGDMCNVLGSGGSRRAAFSIHGVTFAVMVVAGLFLINIF
ncbi:MULTISPECIES: DUF4267 domain-containing protein [Acidobacterium]|uniref:DUF4267 domain-containing protein n=1 Tax=Acidobacterium capsulatum (strain ATCC 51196 / DSM 11244 / BCRC 80197 / JCM 7670 / NBRC 15755 / NCIMB 13165 / 161) TaxID=240015 RepID=C1F4Y7_ACIC5|nr:MULTISPECIES: DUF4267 domain-containing protein [Acidobacterium]ACO31534.1 conserved hypothetical protein [Acidobacterium capsulatum ATCC 51196]HCT61844.1 DUF4267 domain-containing protein [Acidobacterium sp.]